MLLFLVFSDDISESTQSNISAEEWKALRGLAADKTIVIKGADRVRQWLFGIYLLIFIKPKDNYTIRTYTKMLNSIKTYSTI